MFQKKKRNNFLRIDHKLADLNQYGPPFLKERIMIDLTYEATCVLLLLPTPAAPAPRSLKINKITKHNKK
jgi:hypothetical protein